MTTEHQGVLGEVLDGRTARQRGFLFRTKPREQPLVGDCPSVVWLCPHRKKRFAEQDRAAKLRQWLVPRRKLSLEPSSIKPSRAGPEYEREISEREFILSHRLNGKIK